MPRERVSYDLTENYIASFDKLIGGDTEGNSRKSVLVRRFIMRELTDRQREYILLRYVHKMNGAQIARMYGVSRSAVSKTLFRARKRLERFLFYSL